MHFAYGEVSQLEGGNWYPLELHENCVELYLRRVIRALPSIFKAEPAELYIPLRNRDLDEFDLLEGPFIYVRSPYFIGVVRLKKVWGVVGLGTKGGSRLLKDVIMVQDDYVQHLRALEREAEQKRLAGLKEKMGVRVLDGNFRDFCGCVTKVNGEEITVLLNLGFRKIELVTFRKNLRIIPTNGLDVCWVPNLLREVDLDFLQAEDVQ